MLPFLPINDAVQTLRGANLFFNAPQIRSACMKCRGFEHKKCKDCLRQDAESLSLLVLEDNVEDCPYNINHTSMTAKVYAMAEADLESKKVIAMSDVRQKS